MWIHNGKLKRSGINIFIIFCLYAMLSTNANWHLPSIPTHIKPFQSHQEKLHQWNYFIELTDYYLSFVIWATGLNNYWRHFSVMQRSNWKLKFIAVYNDETKELIEIPSQQQRNFWERNFVDFRKDKHFENLYNSERGQISYAHYLCREFQNKEHPIVKIQIDVHDKKFLSPQQAKEKKSFLSPITEITTLRTVVCPN